MDKVLSKKYILTGIILFYILLSLFNYTTVSDYSGIEEDAFIYFKCAVNIAKGHGYVFNRGGERIEVCSSVIWLFILVLFKLIGFELVTTAKFLGIFFGSLSLVMIYKITQQFTDRLPWVLLPSLLASVNVPFLMWNHMGLETALYSFIVFSLIYICLYKVLFKYWPVPALLLFIARPEGFFIMSAILPVFYLYRDKSRQIGISCIYVGIIVLLIFMLRFFYFHDFLPSPFYLKFKSSLQYNFIHQYFSGNFFYFLFVPFLLLFRKKLWDEKRIILTSFTVCFLVWSAMAGKEMKPYYRHFVTLSPILFIFIITLISKYFTLSTSPPKTKKNLSVIVFTYVIVFATASLIFSSHRHENPVSQNIQKFISIPGGHIKSTIAHIQDPSLFKNYQILVGEFIHKNYFDNLTIVYDQMGQTPFGAGLTHTFIDSYGLADKTINRYFFYGTDHDSFLMNGYKQLSRYIIETLFPETEFIISRDDILNFIFEKQPDIIIYNKFCMKKRNDNLQSLFIEDERFKAHYKLKYVLHFVVHVYERNGLQTKPFYKPDGLLCEVK